MSVAIVGTGAIGGFLGCRLAQTGAVTFIEPGGNLAAIPANGMRLIEEARAETGRPAPRA